MLIARRYLSYFHPHSSVAPVREPDVHVLRTLISSNRKRGYVMRAVWDGIFDVDSILELRTGYGGGVMTALARLQGLACGVIANNPMHLAGALDGDACDKLVL